MAALEAIIGALFVFKTSESAAIAAELDAIEKAHGTAARLEKEAELAANKKAKRVRRINIFARVVGFTVYFFTLTNFASSVLFASQLASFSALLNGITFASLLVFYSFRAKLNWRKYSILLAVIAILAAVTLLFTLMQNDATGMAISTVSSISTLLLAGTAWGIPALLRKIKADKAINNSEALDRISTDESVSVSDVVAVGKKAARVPQVIGSVAILLVIVIAIAALAGGRNNDSIPTAVETSSNSAVPAVEAPVATQAPTMPQATTAPLPANINERVPGDYFGYVRKISPALENMGKTAILKAVRPVCVNIVSEGKSVDEAAINLSTTGAFDSSLTLADYISIAELTNTYACPSFKAGV